MWAERAVLAGVALAAAALAPCPAASEAAVLLNEIVADPYGADPPGEYVELRGDPGGSLAGIYFVALEGDDFSGIGTADFVVDLGGQALGTNGLLLLSSSLSPFAPPEETTWIFDPQFDWMGMGAPPGGIENGGITFLLVSSPTPIVEGQQYDAGFDRTLDLPPGAVVLDARWDGVAEDSWTRSTPERCTMACPSPARLRGSPQTQGRSPPRPGTPAS